MRPRLEQVKASVKGFRPTSVKKRNCLTHVNIWPSFTLSPLFFFLPLYLKDWDDKMSKQE
jgi:hypothetical protein